MSVKSYLHPEAFALESGVVLNGYTLSYHCYGSLNSTADNVIWIFHALTASSDAADWWGGLVGSGKLFDPAHYFIVCVNTPGSCYGSSGPLLPGAGNENFAYRNFPFFTTRDLIRSYMPLREHLGIKRIHAGVGGSMGGQQLLEWAVEEPALFEHIIPIATNAFHSAWGIAFNTTQRMAIEADCTFTDDKPEGGAKGMEAARALALLSYRSYAGYAITQMKNLSQLQVNDQGESTGGAASYQRYQGQKLAKRFNAYSYYTLSKTMDSHNVGRARGTVQAALQQITAGTLVIGIDSDVLFPLNEQEYLAQQIPNATLQVISSQFGHDGFLLEFATIEKTIRTFLNSTE